MNPTLHPKTYAPAPPRRVAFLGLGVMGYPMAGHLALAGHHVTAYNRTAAKAAAWCAQLAPTGRAASSPTPFEAAREADLVLCCVGNDDDLRAVTLGEHGAFAAMKPGAIFIDHTTASAHIARELGERAHQQGLAFIDAPVSGGQAGAQNGTLTILCGGTQAAFDAARPTLMAYARACTLLGANGAGQLAKMVNQICLAGLMQGLAEALAFGQRAGLDMPKVLQALSQGAAQSWQMEHRAPTMLERRFDFGFAVEWMRKDLGLALTEAHRTGASLPLTALIDQFYAEIEQMGGRRWDTSSLIKRLP